MTAVYTKVKAPVNFAQLLKPYGRDEDSKKYQVTLMIHKSNTEVVDKINASIDEAWSNLATGTKLKKSKHPLKDGAEIEAYDDRPFYHDYYLLKLSSGDKPEIIDAKGDTIASVSEMSNGKIMIAATAFKAYSHVTGGDGVGAYINAGMFTGAADDAVVAGCGGNGESTPKKAVDLFADELGGTPVKKKLPPKKSEPKYEMTDAAGGWTREELHEQGYSDAELIESELMVLV